MLHQPLPRPIPGRPPLSPSSTADTLAPVRPTTPRRDPLSCAECPPGSDSAPQLWCASESPHLFCLACAASHHAHRKRRGHRIVDVCDECARAPAEVRCRDCDVEGWNLCAACDGVRHEDRGVTDHVRVRWQDSERPAEISRVLGAARTSQHDESVSSSGDDRLSVRAAGQNRIAVVGAFSESDVTPASSPGRQAPKGLSRSPLALSRFQYPVPAGAPVARPALRSRTASDESAPAYPSPTMTPSLEHAHALVRTSSLLSNSSLDLPPAAGAASGTRSGAEASYSEGDDDLESWRAYVAQFRGRDAEPSRPAAVRLPPHSPLAPDPEDRETPRAPVSRKPSASDQLRCACPSGPADDEYLTEYDGALSDDDFLPSDIRTSHAERRRQLGTRKRAKSGTCKKCHRKKADGESGTVEDDEGKTRPRVAVPVVEVTVTHPSAEADPSPSSRTPSETPALTSDTVISSVRRTLSHEAQVVAALAASLDPAALSTAVNLLLATSTPAHPHSRVVVTGLGKSGHIGRKFAATLASTGTPAYFLHAAEALHGDLGMVAGDDVLVALSNSGETPEVVQVARAAAAQGARVVAVTGRPASTLAQLATAHLCAAVDREACPLNLAPTASTTAALACCDAVAVAVMEGRGFTREEFGKRHPGGALGKAVVGN